MDQKSVLSTSRSACPPFCAESYYCCLWVLAAQRNVRVADMVSLRGSVDLEIGGTGPSVWA
jgi:hypothetical protein